MQAHGGQGEVVRAGEGEQAEAVVSSLADAFSDGLDNLVGVDVARRPRQHARLAEPAAASAAAPDLNRHAVVHRLHKWDEAHLHARLRLRHWASSALLAGFVFGTRAAFRALCIAAGRPRSVAGKRATFRQAGPVPGAAHVREREEGGGAPA